MNIWQTFGNYFTIKTIFFDQIDQVIYNIFLFNWYTFKYL